MPTLPGLNRQAFDETRRNAVRTLLAERNEHGWWTGELSSSALSTATAIVALELACRAGCAAAARDAIQPLIDRGLDWLIAKQNHDGGWGDTDKSQSNISTTMLVWAAMGLCDAPASRAVFGPTSPSENHRGEYAPARCAEASNRCESWLRRRAGSLEVPALVAAVMNRYGKDRTFSVPILTMCALCGRLGPVESRDTWQWVMQLPFELAALPRRFFRMLNLQVVSYALPALIAIGQVRHHFRPTRNPITRLARALTKRRTLRLLETIQPPNGGFLEATPLTSFVTMSLAACGVATNIVTRGITFIRQSARRDGSWPIDTNLATWVTTLSVNALAAGGPGKVHEYLNETERTAIRDWLLNQQYKEVHPYTGAAPGGWAWTDLPGGVPDADDTSGAVLALWHLRNDKEWDAWIEAMDHGSAWLASLRNSDQGIPTFCRGWGKLPFDRSCADISAHAHRAWLVRTAAVDEYTDTSDGIPYEKNSIAVALSHLGGIGIYLKRCQRGDGSWAPLWFGDQHASSEENPTYGTSRVVVGLCWPKVLMENERPVHCGVEWLLRAQTSSGGWGGDVNSPPSIEETALAVEALAAAMSVATPQAAEAVVRGVNWLIEHTQRGTAFDPSPIGFYFAKLWYYEKLYPFIFTVAALERVAALLED